MDMPKLRARVRPYRDETGRATKLLAYAELMIADAFVIKGIRVLKKDEPGGGEPFVVFPAEKGKGASAERWFDLAHPITAEAHAAAVKTVLDAFASARA
jgi:DNA-binding cell septation regulator SpoVG